MVVLACLLILDDISTPKEEVVINDTAEVEQIDNQKELAIVENEE